MGAQELKIQGQRAMGIICEEKLSWRNKQILGIGVWNSQALGSGDFASENQYGTSVKHTWREPML